jgi:alkylation response protein AidB-like acyl-CoA dehydrogenase
MSDTAAAVALPTEPPMRAVPSASPDLFAAVRRIVEHDLAPLTVKIDQDGLYPAEILRRIGAAGGFRQHLASCHPKGETALGKAVAIEALVAGECLSTAFLMWCQNACAWYLENTANGGLRERRLPAIAAGEAMGATALSNPMKTLSGIEPLLLGGKRVAGGFIVNGVLPWVSNLGAGHCFGCVFGLEGGAGGTVMAVVDCDAAGLKMPQSSHFTALEGTRTFALRFKDVFVPEEDVLAEPAEPLVNRIRPGFILLQIGLAQGLVRASLEIMRRADRTLAHVNRYLPDRPDAIEMQLVQLEEETALLCATPRETDAGFMRRVFSARALAAELSLRAAQAALLHAGARGYVSHAAAQRRVREAFFIAILTPALKHLRRQIAILDGEAVAPP